MRSIGGSDGQTGGRAGPSSRVVREQDSAGRGEELIRIRAAIDRLEAVFADGLRRFDRSGEYKADGAMSRSPGCAGSASSPAARRPSGSSGATIPVETVRRLACDAVVTRITGRSELEAEISRATRIISVDMRRKLEARDEGCVFEGCDRRQSWTDAHHLIHWADGGPTTLENLGSLCRPHHTRVHEEGWRLERRKDGRFAAIPPLWRVAARSRSA